MPREKSIQLKVLLLKPEIESIEQALKKAELLDKYQLDSELDFQGAIYIQKPIHRSAGWIEFLQQGAQEAIEPCKTATAGSVLFIEAGGRKFALTFGYGRNLLAADCFERGFGLRVVLNTVDPESVRSLDVKTFEDLTLATRRQASRASNLGTFGLDTRKDLLSAVIGKPENEKFAKQIAGSDALTIRTVLIFDQLGAKCEELLSAYASTEYQKGVFAFIDHLKIIRDKRRIETLQQNLLLALSEKQFQSIHLAPPEPIDWENVAEFTYRIGKHAKGYADLDIDEMIAEYDNPANLTIESLKRKHIGVRYRESETSISKWSVFSCIVYETEIDNQLYVLSGGDWFEIEKGFANKVKEGVASLRTLNFSFPSANANENEGEYNARVASDGPFALLDKQNVTLAQHHGPIEICDLLSERRQFIHVKRKTRSATLSHLFSQGVISAELFLWEKEFRAKSKTKLTEVKPAFAHLLTENKPNDFEYEVAYAIIAKPNANWPRSLPFFSQLNLYNATERLNRLGYKTSLTLIEQN